MKHISGHISGPAEEKIAAAVEEATENLAHTWAAIYAGEPDPVVSLWVDRAYDTLRSRLSRQELLTAIMSLVNDAARARARSIKDVRAACPVRDEDLAVAVTEWAKGER